MTPKRRPCKSCPWIVSNTPDTIPNYDPEKAACLARSCRDDGTSVMACHKSREGAEFPCAGFIAQVGVDSIGVRLGVTFGQIRLDDYEPGPEPLHPDFEAMHRAQGVVTPSRNRWGHTTYYQDTIRSFDSGEPSILDE